MPLTHLLVAGCSASGPGTEDFGTIVFDLEPAAHEDEMALSAADAAHAAAA